MAVIPKLVTGIKKIICLHNLKKYAELCRSIPIKPFIVPSKKKYESDHCSSKNKDETRHVIQGLIRTLQAYKFAIESISSNYSN